MSNTLSRVPRLDAVATIFPSMLSASCAQFFRQDKEKKTKETEQSTRRGTRKQKFLKREKKKETPAKQGEKGTRDTHKTQRSSNLTVIKENRHQTQPSQNCCRQTYQATVIRYTTVITQQCSPHHQNKKRSSNTANSSSHQHYQIQPLRLTTVSQ